MDAHEKKTQEINLMKLMAGVKQIKKFANR